MFDFRSGKLSTTNKLVRVRCAIIIVIFLRGVNELHADQVESNGLFYATRVALHAFCTDILENREESVCGSARFYVTNLPFSFLFARRFSSK